MKINKINKSRIHKNSKKMSKKMTKKMSKKMTKKMTKKNKMNGGVNIFSKLFSSRSPSPSSTKNSEVLNTNSVINPEDFKTTTELSIVSGIMTIGNKTKNLKGLEIVKIVDEIVKALFLSGKSLESLDISNNNMTDEQIVSIIDTLLLNNINLITLKLSGNTIGSKSIYSIGKLLKKNTQLKSLDISKSGLQAIHINYLHIELKQNTTLKTLDISDNSIGNEDDTYKHLAGIYIGHIIKDTTLTELYINNNPFTTKNSQITSIILALQKNKTITDMHFTSNEEINKLLDRNKKLKKI